MAVIKERAVSVIVEYVLLSHSPDAFAELRKIKCNSNLQASMLISTRWIKPIHRRMEGQQLAHVIAKFTTTEAVNQSIRDRMIIAGKRTWARRMKREPKHCLRCQKYNARHMAADCTETESCGICGKAHRTVK